MKRFRIFLSLLVVLLFASSAFAGPFMVLPKRGSAWSGSGYPSLDTTGDVSLESTQDGDMVVAEYNNVTINEGHTLTVSNRCKGLKLIVHGDLVVSGTISMTARGASVAGATVDLVSPFDSVKYGEIPAAGAAGAPSVAGDGSGAKGGTGYFRRTGGGGAGARTWGGTSGKGGTGTSYSGGPGGGGGRAATGTGGSDSGGAGGNGAGTSAGGGAGNPHGTNAGFTNTLPEDGTGGLLVIWVAGDVTINSGGIISSRGKKGGYQSASQCATGGGSAGGSINIFYAGTLTNNGSVTAAGGDQAVGDSNNGGPGGDGSVTYTDLNNLYPELAAGAVGAGTITASHTLADGSYGFNLNESNYAQVQTDDACWIQVDLGAVFPIKQIRLRGGPNPNSNKAMTLQISTDGSSFSTIHSFEGDDYWSALSSWIDVNADARYVRVTKASGNFLWMYYMGVKLDLY